jgi:isochorismate synthase
MSTIDEPARVVTTPHRNPTVSSTTAEPSFYFASREGTVSAADQAARLPAEGCASEALPDLAETAVGAAARSGRHSSVLAGVIPFVGSTHARLFLPQRATCSRPTSPPRSVAAPPVAGGSSLSPSALTAQERSFLQIVATAVEKIRGGELRKVVLARAQDFELTHPLRLRALLDALARHEPNSYVFAVAGTSGGPSRTLVGASPELLIGKSGPIIRSQPLAGSARRSRDATEDRARAAGLLRSRKNRHEHELVVERIMDDLQPFMRELVRDEEPSLIGTSSMWHLGTTIRGTLRDPGHSSLRLALALHPTPAVCGTPTAAARSFIHAHEGFERGDFTGVVGYMDAAGDGQWVLALRCAEIDGKRARLFAGAGVVESSDPESELLETRGKMQTMLDVLRAVAAEREPA